jgi:class 3 adenylate cyclase
MADIDRPALDPRITQWIEDLGPDRWAALVLDAQDRLVWVSDELMGFLGETDPTLLGIGDHFVTALLSPTWRETMVEESQLDVFQRAVPLFKAELPDEVFAALPPPFDLAVAGLEARPRVPLVAGGFGYVRDDLPAYRVEYLLFELRDATGARIGSVGITNQGMRPTLLALLARGDVAMYERMSRLVQPHQHAAAILFADLEASGELSRQLPTSRYFAVVRDLATSFDEFVAAECGIIGKHVGDGMTGFFLASDAGCASSAAVASIRTARRLQEATTEIAEQLEAEGFGLTSTPRVRAGLHYGSALYLGQLVPGGRLDVTALGDEVNECARIEEMARGGRLLASKQLIESLDADDAKAIGLDPQRMSYRPVATLTDPSAKAVRDAGALAVTDVGG